LQVVHCSPWWGSPPPYPCLWTQDMHCQTSRSCKGKNEDDCLLEYCIMQSCRNWHFTGAYCPHCPDDGGSKHLWNISQFLRDYLLQHPRRWSTSKCIFYKICALSVTQCIFHTEVYTIIPHPPHQEKPTYPPNLEV
jgi:hypothetical protein